MGTLKDFVVRYNELAREERISTFSKGDLMKMAYGETYRNVDSALPMGILEEEGISKDEYWHYVMDYNNNGAFGHLTDLFDVIAKKNPTIEVYNSMYELTDTLPILDAVKKYENQDILWQIKRSDKSSKYAKGSTIKGKELRGEFGTFVYQIMENGIIREEKIVRAGYSKFVRKMAEEEAMKFGVRSEVIVRKLSDKKYNNGGGVAVSSESGLAVGTNADLLMNQNNLQYADGGGVGEKKYLFVSYNVTVNEDSFEEGESIEVFSEYDEKVGKVYNSMENLLKDMNRIMGTEYSKDDFDFETGEGRNIQTDVLVDEDFIPPDANEVEKWRKGELKLYNAHYKFYVMPIYVADQYANGGNMSMGFNYSIGGL